MYLNKLIVINTKFSLRGVGKNVFVVGYRRKANQNL